MHRVGFGHVKGPGHILNMLKAHSMNRRRSEMRALQKRDARNRTCPKSKPGLHCMKHGIDLDRVDARMGWKEAERLRDMQTYYEEEHLRRRIRSMMLTSEM